MFKVGDIINLKKDIVNIIVDDYGAYYDIDNALLSNFTIIRNKGFKELCNATLYDIISNRNNIVLVVYENEIEFDIVYYRQLKLKNLIK